MQISDIDWLEKHVGVDNLRSVSMKNCKDGSNSGWKWRIYTGKRSLGVIVNKTSKVSQISLITLLSRPGDAVEQEDLCPTTRGPLNRYSEI